MCLWKILLFATLIPFFSVSSAEIKKEDWFSLGNFGYKNHTTFIYKKRQYDDKKDARSFTTRNDISWQSPNLFGLSFFTEWHSTEKFADKYQDRPYKDAKNHGQYTIIPDSDGNRFQELYGKMDFSLGSIKAGWQRIDDGKFIRHFDWRQNSESYRSISFNFNLPYNSKIVFAQAYKLYDRWMNSTEYDSMSILTLTNDILDSTSFKFRFIGIRDGYEGKSKQNRGDKDTYSLEINHTYFDFLYAYQAPKEKPSLNYFEGKLKFPILSTLETGLTVKIREEKDGHFFDFLNSPPPNFFGWTESYGLFANYQINKWTFKAAHNLLNSPLNDARIGANETFLKTEYEINKNLTSALIFYYLDVHGNKGSQQSVRGDELIIRVNFEFSL